MLSLDAESKLHTVVLQLAGVDQAFVAIGHHLAFGFGIAFVAESEVLLARLVGGKLPYHCTVRIRSEVGAFVLHAILVEGNHGHCRVDGKDTLIVAHTDFAQACFDVGFTEGSIRTEAEGLFAIVFVTCQAIEVLASQLGGFLQVVVHECLADFGKQMSRFLVHVPIIVGTLGGVRTSSPEGLFVQGDTFGSYRAEDVATKATITDRKGTFFPITVGAVVVKRGHS